MPNDSKAVFLTRTFGFSLFWIWLFLVAVSPSPLYGALVSIQSIPFEVWEVGIRLILLVASLFSVRWLTTMRGRWFYPLCCIIAGPVTAIALSLASNPLAVVLAAIPTALVDVAMLIMWLCYFGYARLGDTAFMLACSYAFGSILYLIIVAAGQIVMFACSFICPVVSGILFIQFVKNPSTQTSEGLFQASQAQDPHFKLPGALWKLAAGLVLYAFVFAFYSSRTAVSEYTLLSGPVVQAIASILLAFVVIIAIRASSVSTGLYALYRSVPLLFACGIALFLLTPSTLPLLGGLFVMLAYLMFEALSFNDFCNASKTNDGSLLKSMVVVRIAGSLGIFIGWVLGTAIAGFTAIEQSPCFVATICFVALIVASSLVFTDKTMGALGTIAGTRARQEATEARLDRSLYVPHFAAHYDLSKREAEVVEYLLQGRTMQYAAEKLFISESTARSHVHKIYQKTGTQGRMELIDCFEHYCSEFADTPGLAK